MGSTKIVRRLARVVVSKRLLSKYTKQIIFLSLPSLWDCLRSCRDTYPLILDSQAVAAAYQSTGSEIEIEFEFALPWRPQETEIRPLLALVPKVVVQVLLPSVLF